MGLFSRFEDKAEDVIEGGGKGGLEPVKLAKRAAKEMQREKMVGVGREYAPTLYNVLVSPTDDDRMYGYYPTLAGEIETYLTGRANESGLTFDCPPLVRFIVDEGLKRGRFDIIAESVSPSIIEELRHEEMVHYGIEEPQAQPVPTPARSRDAVEPEPFDPLAPSDSQQPYTPAAQPLDVPEYAPVAAAVSPAISAPQTYPPMGADQTVMIESTGAPLGRATLVDYETEARHPLLRDHVIVGREAVCDIVLGEPSVSRRHAEIIHDAGGWIIRDLGSTNGVKVNGKRASQTPIFDGDQITLGNARMQFQEA